MAGHSLFQAFDQIIECGVQKVGSELMNHTRGKRGEKKRQETFYSQIFRAHYYHNAWNRLNNQAFLAGSLA